jgi:hypothetical protein
VLACILNGKIVAEEWLKTTNGFQKDLNFQKNSSPERMENFFNLILAQICKILGWFLWGFQTRFQHTLVPIKNSQKG